MFRLNVMTASELVLFTKYSMISQQKGQAVLVQCLAGGLFLLGFCTHVDTRRHRYTIIVIVNIIVLPSNIIHC